MKKELIKLKMASSQAKHPNMHPDCIPRPVYSDKTANGLTKMVIDWITLNGGQAERISNMGRYIDSSKVVTNVLGQRIKIGSGKFIPGAGTNGTADISAIIKGKSVKIEVKMKDKQSEAQKKYQESVERAGGIYYIVRSFDDFMEKYISLL
jgi:hypothetical protein